MPQLLNEDLKRHEERFKEELNRNTINSIAVFDSQLEKHEKDIKLKIQHINKHLREIVYDLAFCWSAFRLKSILSVKLVV